MQIVLFFIIVLRISYIVAIYKHTKLSTEITRVANYFIYTNYISTKTDVIEQIWGTQHQCILQCEINIECQSINLEFSANEINGQCYTLRNIGYPESSTGKRYITKTPVFFYYSV